jgi:hypothetical protein
MIADEGFGFTVEVEAGNSRANQGGYMRQGFAYQQAAFPDERDFFFRFIKDHVDAFRPIHFMKRAVPAGGLLLRSWRHGL